jgi:hypothetical protein
MNATTNATNAANIRRSRATARRVARREFADNMKLYVWHSERLANHTREFPFDVVTDGIIWTMASNLLDASEMIANEYGMDASELGRVAVYEQGAYEALEAYIYMTAKRPMLPERRLAWATPRARCRGGKVHNAGASYGHTRYTDFAG